MAYFRPKKGYLYSTPHRGIFSSKKRYSTPYRGTVSAKKRYSTPYRGIFPRKKRYNCSTPYRGIFPGKKRYITPYRGIFPATKRYSTPYHGTAPSPTRSTIRVHQFSTEIFLTGGASQPKNQPTSTIALHRFVFLKLYFSSQNYCRPWD